MTRTISLKEVGLEEVTLGPCPFCRRDAAEIVEDTRNGVDSFIAVECRRCHAQGPPFYTDGTETDSDDATRHAVEHWNEGSVPAEAVRDISERLRVFESFAVGMAPRDWMHETLVWIGFKVKAAR
jgi:hypothetical protein